MIESRLEHVVALVSADGTRHQVVQERHPSRSYGAQFVILFTDAMEAAARSITSAVTLRVLMLLPKHLSFTDFKHLPTTELAAGADTDQPNVSRAMRRLHQLGIVERLGTGPRTAWRMSSDWGWNGTADQWRAMRAGRLKGKRPPAKAPAGPDPQSQNEDYGISRTVQG